MLCTRCCNTFEPKVHNAKYCNNSCAKQAQRIQTKAWHQINRDSENAKSRARIALYSKEEMRDIYRRFRISKGLGTLDQRECIICFVGFMPNSANDQVCSIECCAIRDRVRNSTAFKKRYQTDIQFKLSVYLRNRLNKFMKGNLSTINELNCSLEELTKYLESQFLPGMSWDNWSTSGWHIDHIRPLASFDLTDDVQFKEACGYKNLQPLWAKDNFSKGSIWSSKE